MFLHLEKNDVVSLNPKSSSASAVAGFGVTVYLCSLFGAVFQDLHIGQLEQF